MELELNREHINCHDLVLSTELTREETLEAIVPDACPDILRIVDVSGVVCLTAKEVRDGSLMLAGQVKALVLYQPEDGVSLCRMEVALPFTAGTDDGRLSSMGQCVAAVCLRGVDARALNPRKVLVRADIGLGIQVFQPQELVLCSGIRSEEGDGVQLRTQEHTAYMTAAVAEKEFTIYDEVRLSAGPSGPAQLLGVRAQPVCTESKVIGNKLIFKGEAELQVRYQVNGELCAVRSPLAFSQIMELSDVGEGGDCALELCLTDVDCVLAGEDERTLNVTLEVLGQAVVREQRPLRLLQDAYSTACPLMVEQESVCLSRLTERAVRPQSVRELLETGSMVKSVIDAAVTVCEVTQGRQEEQLTVGAQLRAELLYLDENDAPQKLSRTLSVSGRLDVSAGSRCRCRCLCPGEVFAVPAAGGVELRFNLEFEYLVTAPLTLPVITGVRPGEAAPGRTGSRPSVVLRMAAPGESLWDIAKAFSTTQERICQANQLESEELPAGQMLLIPSAR